MTEYYILIRDLDLIYTLMKIKRVYVTKDESQV